MNRSLLKKLSQTRIVEAQTLFANRGYSGAYYLAGYAVECALKACIARKTRLYAFPDKNFASKCYTHDLKELVKLADLEPSRLGLIRQDTNFNLNWTVAKDWNETSRYEVFNRVRASELIFSITDPNSGILQWLQQHW